MLRGIKLLLKPTMMLLPECLASCTSISSLQNETLLEAIRLKDQM